VTAFQNGDSAKLQEIAKRAAIVSFGLTVPITLTLWLFGDWLIGVSFGEAYVKAALPAVITVAAGQTMAAFLGSVWPLLTMTGHEKRALGGLCISFTLNVLLCLWLAPAYGATGAAVATAVSLVTCKLLFSIEVKRLLSINSRVF
jgi:O-antigen/teichoic acid export membrane protein